VCGVALSLIIGPRSLCVSLCRVSVSPSSACLIECVICFLISTLFSTLFFYDDECSFVFSRLRFSTVCVVISTRLSPFFYPLSFVNPLPLYSYYIDISIVNVYINDFRLYVTLEM